MGRTRTLAGTWPSRDWVALAELLAERGEQPFVLLDRRGTIVLVNGATERALGWGRDEIEGRSWVELCTPPDQSLAIARRLNQALAGGLRQYECEAVDREGRRIRLALELIPVGTRSQFLLLVVQRVTAVDELPADLARHELDYEISTAPTSFGSVQQVELIGRRMPGMGDGRRVCFELLHNRHAPCEDCPVLRDGRETWPRMIARPGRPDTNSFTVITAEPARAGMVRVRVRFVSDGTLRVIHQARLAALAEQARLSRREKSVLEYLLMGRSLDDIATILGLRRSTVKFHQANILAKLGADSRVDLARLLGL
jgi:PAS domain S-box-containing protein